MDDGILSPQISQIDASTSLASIEQLRRYLLGGDRSLVFFVGAGASFAGNTQMPTTPTLLQQILLDALKRSGEFDTRNSAVVDALKDLEIGFEITLNDFWQICGKAIRLLYASLAKLDEICIPNHVHAFLAYWLSTGGIVLTTNYDRLIERARPKIDYSITVRYREKGDGSFTNWQSDLSRGGCLFKLHGSLDDLDSCLGALEHVGTRLAGHRADLLAEIVRHRPLCFVGWSGADPDIPPLLNEFHKTRDSPLPSFWIHFEGRPPGSISIEKAIGRTSPLVQEYAGEHPIVTEADRAFKGLLTRLGIDITRNTSLATARLDFGKAMEQCSASGVTRFVGIALRRAGRLDIGEQVLEVARKLAQTDGERSAAIQELALIGQQITGRKTDQSRKLLGQAREALGGKPDFRLQLNVDFGMVSMTIVGLRSRPWLLLKVPGLFRKYRQDIELLRSEMADRESIALHESLLRLYEGRLRFILFGWLAIAVPLLAEWILQPFNIARATIDDAKDIHLHSRVDVLAYRAVALARFRRCRDAMGDVPEIARLIAILKDDARATHWVNQRHEIERYCNDTTRFRS